MICANCGKQTTHGYFWEGRTVHYICTDCLLSYKENLMNKYDHEMIMRLHKAGIPVKRIAEIVGAKHEMTIRCIIRKETGSEQTDRPE